MERIPLSKYAKMRKMSRAQVIHMIVKGEIEAEEVVENGKKVRYVLVEKKQTHPVQQQKKDVPLPETVLVHIQKFADISSMKYCYEGMHDYYLVFEDQLIIFNKESAVVTMVPKCEEKE
ncbi:MULTISPECIES: hypothetical protein [unclassified Nitratiruptor]|uniref:hypothetical protein n=1 Tax=unclassified Nitratiruptor TaxID=2624044 RepID=UPI001915CC3E|nr:MULTISPECIES: hypothetical protein [unclassified Nitratiruptor]BCD60121.1 hypothetical protein NitYY0810_C0886 [Nitratiruptor sp. YY08-10]BCD64390.1 hypothetical protein NitYY0814_C1235 [Nitratiruptor sp. YY08-14]